MQLTAGLQRGHCESPKYIASNESYPKSFVLEALASDISMPEAGDGKEATYSSPNVLTLLYCRS